MNKILIILISIIALPYSNSGQNCFTILGDFNGFQNVESISELQNKSCELIDTLPSRFSSDFRVFDFGFYPIKEFTPEKFTSDWENAKNISSDSSQYYLLIGREASINGNYHKIHIDLKFPTTFEFSCVTDEQIAYIRFQIEKEVNKIKGNLLVEIESVALDLLIKFIDDKIICCNSSNRNICGNCLETEEFVTYVEDNNFKTIEVSTLTSTNYTNLTQHVKQYAQLNFIQDGISINVNEEIISILDEISEYADSVLIEIHSFNQDCETAFNIVENKHFVNSGDTYFHIKVIGLDSPLGDKILISVESNIYQGKGDGSLYILNKSTLNTDTLKLKTKEFFDLAALKIKLKTMNKKTKIGTTDGFIVLANSRQKVVDLIFGNSIIYLDLSSNDFPINFIPKDCQKCKHQITECYNTNTFLDWPAMPFLVPEITANRGIGVNVEELDGDDSNYINFRYSNNNDDNDLRKPGGIYRSAAFMVLHGTAHTAGFYHNSIPVSEGYCKDADQIALWLNCNNGSDCLLNTYEKIIQDTKKNYNYMIVQTNKRYGYSE